MKKCIIFFLIAMLILPNSAMLVSADTPVFNTLDTFDTLATGKISAADLTSYAKAFGTWFYPEGAALEITEDGYNGGKALTITENDTTKFQIALLNDTVVFAPTEDSPVYVSFKLKIKNNVDNAAKFQVNSGYDSLFNIMLSGSDYVFIPTNSSQRIVCVPDEWYDIQVKFSPGRADVKITDKDGSSITGYRANNSNYLYMYSSGGSAAPSMEGQSIAFDEIKMLQGEEISATPQVYTPDGVVDTSEEVVNISRLPEFSFRYEPFMNVKSGDISVDVTGGAAYALTTNFETVNVKFTQMLEKNTQYTITLSGVKDTADLPVDPYSFTFTTEIAHKLTLAENGLNIISGDSPAIELTFDGTLGYPSTDVIVMSVIYDEGRMTYLDYRAATIDAVGKLLLSSYTLPAGKQLSDLTILVFADSKKLIPVCEAIKCFE